jgi:hypothetical protein
MRSLPATGWGATLLHWTQRPRGRDAWVRRTFREAIGFGPLKVGMVGTIVRVYDFVVDAYLVQLDDQADPHHL